MVTMATWEDGPEYAPLVRPDAFTEPTIPPLSSTPPVEQLAAAAPKERPAFADPRDSVAPLERLIPPIEVRHPSPQPEDGGVVLVDPGRVRSGNPLCVARARDKAAGIAARGAGGDALRGRVLARRLAMVPLEPGAG